MVTTACSGLLQAGPERQVVGFEVLCAFTPNATGCSGWGGCACSLRRLPLALGPPPLHARADSPARCCAQATTPTATYASGAESFNGAVEPVTLLFQLLDDPSGVQRTPPVVTREDNTAARNFCWSNQLGKWKMACGGYVRMKALRVICGIVVAAAVVSLGAMPYLFPPPITAAALATWKLVYAAIAVTGFLSIVAELIVQEIENKRRDRQFDDMQAVLQDVKFSLKAKSEPLPPPPTAEIAGPILVPLPSPPEVLPGIEMTGYQYLWLNPDEHHVWRADASGRKSLLFIFENKPDAKGKGIDVKGLRAQIDFQWDTGAPGPSFAPVPWLNEEFAFIDMPLGVQKKLVMAVSFGQHYGWGTYKSSRVGADWKNGASPLESDPVPMKGKLRVRLVASIGGESRVVFLACFSWRIEYGPNHPWFQQIDCKEMDDKQGTE